MMSTHCCAAGHRLCGLVDIGTMKSLTFTGYDKSDVDRQIWIWRAANSHIAVKKIHSPRYMPASIHASRTDKSKSKRVCARVLIRMDYES